MLAPTTWLLALVLLVASLVRWRRAVLRLLPWTAASVLLALIGVALGSGPEPGPPSSSGGVALLFSPARGALFFVPVVLVCLAGIVRVLRPPRGRRLWEEGAAVSWLPLAAVLMIGLGVAAAAAEGKVNINKAGVEQLALLPRVGPAVAQRIVDFREQNGDFKSAEDLMMVRGIGEKTFERLAPYVSISGETTLTEKVRSSARGSEGGDRR